MKIHPTRTNLLLLKEKARSVSNSMAILRARKQALLRAFLETSVPFLRSREEIRDSYERALREISIAIGIEGLDSVESLVAATEREFSIEITDRSIWGLHYRDISYHDTAVRGPDDRGYDESATTTHLEECAYLFEKLLESMLSIAQFENRLKRLGDEINRTTRRINVLEELVLPELKKNIRTIAHYIAERERESYYRLKKFKDLKTGSRERNCDTDSRERNCDTDSRERNCDTGSRGRNCDAGR